jgi:hypothetical protein
MSKRHTITVKNIDLELLEKQRLLLVALIYKKRNAKLEGLVHMLDEMIDSCSEGESIPVYPLNG